MSLTSAETSDIVQRVEYALKQYMIPAVRAELVENIDHYVYEVVYRLKGEIEAWARTAMRDELARLVGTEFRIAVKVDGGEA